MTSRDFYCPVCLNGADLRLPNQTCSRCRSFQRHRVMLPMALIQLECIPDEGAVVDLSPHACVEGPMREAAGDAYVSMDLDASSRVSVVGDLCHLPFADASARLILCSHVLEHIPDDGLALAELRRVLAPTGEMLIQVPRRRGVPTEEAVGATPEEMERRFGQADHVRLYGDDFESRLEAAGFLVHTTSYQRLLPRPVLSLIGVEADHELWIAGNDPDGSTALNEDRLLSVLAKGIISAFSEVDNALEEADDWRSRYEWLASRPAVRWARWIKHKASPSRNAGKP